MGAGSGDEPPLADPHPVVDPAGGGGSNVRGVSGARGVPYLHCAGLPVPPPARLGPVLLTPRPILVGHDLSHTLAAFVICV